MIRQIFRRMLSGYAVKFYNNELTSSYPSFVKISTDLRQICLNNARKKAVPYSF